MRKHTTETLLPQRVIFFRGRGWGSGREGLCLRLIIYLLCLLCLVVKQVSIYVFSFKTKQNEERTGNLGLLGECKKYF